MLYNENEDLKLIMESYINLGFSVKVDGEFLVLEKPGEKQERISIKFAIDFLNSIDIENY